MGLIVDTSVLINLERQKLPLTAAVANLQDEPLAICSVVASELLIGVERANTVTRQVKRRLDIEKLLDSFPIFPFDLAAARIHAAIWGNLAASGMQIGSHVLLIAATALANNHGVLTCIQRDFLRVPGLRVAEPKFA